MCAAWQANPSKFHLCKTLLASLVVSICAPLRAEDSGIFLRGGFQYAPFTLHTPSLKKEHLYGGDVEMGWMSFLCQKKSKNSPYCAKSSPFGMRFYALFNRQFGNHNTLQNYFAGGAFDLLFNFLDNTTWTFWGLCGGSWSGGVFGSCPTTPMPISN